MKIDVLTKYAGFLLVVACVTRPEIPSPSELAVSHLSKKYPQMLVFGTKKEHDGVNFYGSSYPPKDFVNSFSDSVFSERNRENIAEFFKQRNDPISDVRLVAPDPYAWKNRDYFSSYSFDFDHKKVLNFYCHNKKQVQPLTLKLSGIVMPHPAGVSLDKAEKFRAEQVSRLRAEARDFFRWNEFVWLIPKISSSEIEKKLKNRDIYFEGGNHKEHFQWKRPEIPHLLPPAVTKDSGFYMGLGMSYDQKKDWEAVPALLATTTLRRKLVIIVPPPEEKTIYYNYALNTALEAFRSEKDRAPTQSELSEITTELERHMDTWHGTFFDKNGRLNTEALADEDKIQKMWDKYFQAMTTTKEVQTPDPNRIDFEVSLDLNPVCAYSQPKNNFITN